MIKNFAWYGPAQKWPPLTSGKHSQARPAAPGLARPTLPHGSKPRAQNQVWRRFDFPRRTSPPDKGETPLLQLP